MHSIRQQWRASVAQQLFETLFFAEPAVFGVITRNGDKTASGDPVSRERDRAGFPSSWPILRDKFAVDVMLVPRRKPAVGVRVRVTLPLLLRHPTGRLQLVLGKFAVRHRELHVAKVLYCRNDVQEIRSLGRVRRANERNELQEINLLGRRTCPARRTSPMPALGVSQSRDRTSGSGHFLRSTQGAARPVRRDSVL